MPLTWENTSYHRRYLIRSRGTFQVTNHSVFYPRPVVDSGPVLAVGHAGAVLLAETVRASGSAPGCPRWWRRGASRLAVHDPAKTLLDVAVPLALGGEFCSDVGLLCTEPDLFGRVASNPMISRTIDTLAAESIAVLAAVDTARATGRAQVWSLAGVHAPDHQASAAHPVVVDFDATLVGSHSEKENARPTYKRGFGFHPLGAFVDQGCRATGNHWPCCSAKATPGPTPPPTPSPSPRSQRRTG